ncbi:MAG: 4Fe-4S dicluster domain-containing protein [Thermodesulfobacteriota bacterium]
MTVFATPPDAVTPTEALRSLLTGMLSKGLAAAVLAPARSPHGKLPMPMLISNPAALIHIDPLAPVAPFNSARQAASVTRHASGRRLALFLRPCEIAAFRELIKLHQCEPTDTLIISMDCRGRMENDTYLKLVAEHGDLTEAFYRDKSLEEQTTTACRMCERFQPRGADLTLCLLGADDRRAVWSAETEAGGRLLNDLGLVTTGQPAGRETAVEELRRRRSAFRTERLAAVADKTKTMEGFQQLIAACLNCYNCRTACPVCYCRECVFLTDVFAHPPETLLQRAAKKGMLKLPADTTMFHLTRMAHMTHACVGCGQCSSVCPSHIPVADIFQLAAADVQQLFDYQPGRSLEEPIPYLAYKKETR